MEHRVKWMQKLLFYQQTARMNPSSIEEIVPTEDKFRFHNVGSVPALQPTNLVADTSFSQSSLIRRGSV